MACLKGVHTRCCFKHLKVCRIVQESPVYYCVEGILLCTSIHCQVIRQNVRFPSIVLYLFQLPKTGAFVVWERSVNLSYVFIFFSPHVRFCPQCFFSLLHLYYFSIIYRYFQIIRLLL